MERKANRIWIGIYGIANVANPEDRTALEDAKMEMVVRQEVERGRESMEVKSP